MSLEELNEKIKRLEEIRADIRKKVMCLVDLNKEPSHRYVALKIAQEIFGLVQEFDNLTTLDVKGE